MPKIKEIYMEKVIQNFKNLFKGEDIAKKHLTFAAWLILPALMISYIRYADKDTPTNTVIYLACVSVVLLVLSVVPLVSLLGYYIRFCKDRLNDAAGIPLYEKSITKDGWKALPLGIMWTLYSLIFGLILLCVPVTAYIVVYKMNMGSLALGLCTLFSVLYCLGMCVLGFILSPFVSYIYIEFADNGRKIYNPLVIIEYIKKTFRETILVALKYLLVNIVMAIANGIFAFVIAALIFIAGVILALFATNPDTVLYHPVSIFVITVPMALQAIVKLYSDFMVSFAATENYVDIYRRLIKVQ